MRRLWKGFFFSSPCMIPSDIFKVPSSFCQTDFTVINTSAPSASLLDCLLLYVKRKCQSNFLPAYLHDNEPKTNRRQLAEITESSSALLHAPVKMWRRRGCTPVSVCFHVHGYQKEEGLWQWEMPERDCFDSQLNLLIVEELAVLNWTVTSDWVDINNIDPSWQAKFSLSSLSTSCSVLPAVSTNDLQCIRSPHNVSASPNELCFVTPQHSCIFPSLKM